jgi:hypothetical protein
VISAIGRTDAMGVPRAVFLLGLNQEDLAKLSSGGEVLLEMGELGLPPLQLRVRAGESNDALWAQLPQPRDGQPIPRMRAGSTERVEVVREGLAKIQKDVNGNGN